MTIGMRPMTGSNEIRPHEMSYGELSALINEIRADLNRWKKVADMFHDAVFVDADGAMNAAPTDLKAAFQAWVDANAVKAPEAPKKSSIQESVDFVVDMMNAGVGIDPADVYPRNRYHGD